MPEQDLGRPISEEHDVGVPVSIEISYTHPPGATSVGIQAGWIKRSVPITQKYAHSLSILVTGKCEIGIPIFIEVPRHDRICVRGQNIRAVPLQATAAIPQPNIQGKVSGIRDVINDRDILVRIAVEVSRD